MACKSRISVDQRMVWDAICRSIGSLEECKALELREGLKTRAFLFSFFVSWLKAVCVRNSVAMEVEGDEEYSRTLEEDLGGLKVERDAAVQGVVIDFLRLIFKTLRVFLEMEKEGLARMVRPRDCTEGTARAL